MNTLNLRGVAASVVAVAAGHAWSQTIQTIGPSSAVKFVDRSADFGALAVNGQALSDYREGGLVIATDGDSWVGEPGGQVFDPFHGANGNDRVFYFPFGGSPGWTIIRAADGRRIYGLEFMYGNGWTTGQIYGPYPWGNNQAIVEWRSWRGSSMAGSGVIGQASVLEMGTVVGFCDVTGLDRLEVRCTIASSGDPTLQALALDNLVVQTTCPADRDHSGTLAPADIAQFVNDWFISITGGTLDGDFDGNGLVEPADIADFVNAWFAALSSGQC